VKVPSGSCVTEHRCG